MYRLTREGEEYRKNGLPEIQLLHEIKKGLHIGRAKKRLDELKDKKYFAIGFGWAKKNGWIEVKDGEVQITEQGEHALKEKDKITSAIENIETADIEAIKILISRKLIEEVKEKTVEKVKETTNEIAQLTPEIIKTGLWKFKQFRKYNAVAPAPQIYPGKKQPYVRFLNDIRERLASLGFVEVNSPLVELEFWNFDALFQAQDHPAREVHDVFNVKGMNGSFKGRVVDSVKKMHEDSWGYKWSFEKAMNLVLRSQTTTSSARYLSENHESPLKMFCIGRIFRPDVLDKTHLIEFDQCEGIIMDKNLNFRHLLGILKEFGENIIGVEKLKFVPSYYPFTEPSVDMYVYFPKLKKWVEVLGAGMFRPEILSSFGINEPVLAWGIGISRLAMLKLGIDDIRYLFADDLNWLRNKSLVS